MSNSSNVIASQSQIKKQLTLNGGSEGVVLLNEQRIGQYRTEKGAGGNAVLVARVAKQYAPEHDIRGGNKEGLIASLAKEIYRMSKQHELEVQA